MLRKLISAGFVLVALAAFADFLNVRAVLADEKTSLSTKEAWKPEDFIYTETAGQFRISPDAKWVVWVKTSSDKDKQGSEVGQYGGAGAACGSLKDQCKDKKITRLTANSDWIEDFGVSPDAKYVVASHAKSLHYQFDQLVRPVVILHDLSSGQEKRLFADLRVRAEGFEWAPDSSGFYMATPFSTDSKVITAGITIIYFYDMASGASTQVNLDNANGLGFDLQTVPGGFVALLAAGSHDDLAFYSAGEGGSGWRWERGAIAGEHAGDLEGVRVSADGKAIVDATSTASKPSQPYWAQLGGGKMFSPCQMAQFNDT